MLIKQLSLLKRSGRIDVEIWEGIFYDKITIMINYKCYIHYKAGGCLYYFNQQVNNNLSGLY